MSTTTPLTGKVKFFNDEKGYGFIVCDDGSKDVFVHKTGTGGLTLDADDRVSFDRVPDAKGFKAVNVRRI